MQQSAAQAMSSFFGCDDPRSSLSLCILHSHGNVTKNHRLSRRLHSDALLDVPWDKLLQKDRSVCDRFTGYAYTLTPHFQLYRSVQHLHTSGTAEPHHRVPHEPRPTLARSLTPYLPNSSSATPFFSSAPVHNHSTQGMEVSIVHGVAPKPILKRVTENKGSVWMRYRSSRAFHFLSPLFSNMRPHPRAVTCLPTWLVSL